MLIDVRRSPLLLALLLIAYIVTPVREWGLLAGRPLDLLSTAALAAVCWLWAGPHRDRLVRRPYAVVLAIALVLKVALGATLLLPRGFDARYYANARFEPPVEPSAESRDASSTRIDRRLYFGFEGAPDVPVAFFNEIRFNYFHEHDPKREGLPFSVMWQGLWRVTASGKQQVYVRSPGGTVDFTMGDVLAERIDATEEWTGQVDLPAGLHRVMISWSVPQDGARRFAAGRLVDGGEEPFDERVIVRRRAGGAAFVSDRLVRAGSTIFDALLLAWLLVQTVRQTARSWRNLRLAYNAADAIALAWMFGVVDALVFAGPAVGRMVTLSGGDDWLLYESYARDIVLNGPLMILGQPLGRGTPYSAQPLYAYFLAACHWLSGDGLFGIYFVQRLLVAATVIALWRATARVFDEKVGLAALVTGVVVAYQKMAGWSFVLLAEVMFTSLFAWWSYVLTRLARTASEPSRSSPMRWMAVSAGVIGGLATLARSSVPTGWVFALPLVAFAIPRNRQRTTVLALLMSTMLAVCSLATIRNWVVAHKLVLITAQGPQGLFLGNPPPPLDTPPAYKAWYQRFDVDPRVEKVIEFARQQPLQFAAGLARKAQYTLGWFGTMLEGAPTSRFYIAVWMLALAGVFLSPWMRPVSLPLALVPFALAASHFVATVIIMPQVYVDRAIVPLYLLLVPSAAIPVALFARWITGAVGGRRAAVLPCVVLLAAAILKMWGWFPAVDFDVVAVALLTAGVCLGGLPSGRPWLLAMCTIYVLALTVSFVRAPSSETAAMLRTGSLFVATAIASAHFLKGPDTFRVAIGWACFAAAAAGAAVLLSLGLPTGVVEEFAESLRHAFGYLSSYGAAAGFVLLLAAVAVRRRAPTAQRALIYTAGAALMVSALHWVGAMITPQRWLLQRELAIAGVVGVVAYTAIWVDTAWPRGRDLSARACQGLALGMFVTILFGTVIGHAGVAPTIAAGLLIGVIQAERGAV